MKILSVLQPWASLIVFGEKKIETRSWNTKHRGPLFIHASAKKNDTYRGIMLDFQQEFFSLQLPAYKNLPFGAIIGQVNMIDTGKTNNVVEWESQNVAIVSDKELTFIHLSKQEKAFGDYSPDRYGWLLTDPVQFETPIPVKGKLGLWEYDYKPVETVKPL